MKIPFLSRLLRGRKVKAEYETAYSYAPEESLAWASKLCIGPERKKVRYMRRDTPKFSKDSGWMLFSGEEAQPLDPAAFVMTALPLFIREDASLERPLASPVGSEWTRKPPDDEWLRIVGENVVDQNGAIVGATR